jgi:hypothetical protein
MTELKFSPFEPNTPEDNIDPIALYFHPRLTINLPCIPVLVKSQNASDCSNSSVQMVLYTHVCTSHLF